MRKHRPRHRHIPTPTSGLGSWRFLGGSLGESRGPVAMADVDLVAFMELELF